MKRDTRSAYRSRAKATETMVDNAVSEVRAEAHAQFVTARDAARTAEAARVKLTRVDIEGATHVRTSSGWHRVVRINAATVTVETGYSWTDRHRFDRILEVRTVD